MQNFGKQFLFITQVFISQVKNNENSNLALLHISMSISVQNYSKKYEMSIGCLKISIYKINIKTELQRNSVNFFDTIMTKSAFATVRSKPQGFGTVSSSD
jgi:hypothetical protein